MNQNQILESAYARMARMDVPKAGARYRVKVRSQATGHVVGGHVLEAGDNEFEVHEDELRALREQVESIPEHQLRVIDEKYDRAVKEWAAEGGTPSTAPYSREFFVRDVTGRDPRPLVSVEVLEEIGAAEGASKGSKKAG